MVSYHTDLQLTKAHIPNRMSKRATRVTKKEVQAMVENADGETLSIRALMARQDSTRIIADPREYQLELFERAKTDNVIAVLDTGLQIQTVVLFQND